MFKFITVTLIFAKASSSSNSSAEKSKSKVNGNYNKKGQQEQQKPKPQHSEHFKDMPMRVQKISPKVPQATHPAPRKRDGGSTHALGHHRGKRGNAKLMPLVCPCVYVYRIEPTTCFLCTQRHRQRQLQKSDSKQKFS